MQQVGQRQLGQQGGEGEGGAPQGGHGGQQGGQAGGPGRGQGGPCLGGPGGGVTARGQKVGAVPTHRLLPLPPLGSPVLEPDLEQ